MDYKAHVTHRSRRTDSLLSGDWLRVNVRLYTHTFLAELESNNGYTALGQRIAGQSRSVRFDCFEFSRFYDWSARTMPFTI